jgi:hypothetical protein
MNLKRKNKDELIKMFNDSQTEIGELISMRNDTLNVLSVISIRLQKLEKQYIAFEENFGHPPHSYSIWKLLFNKSYRNQVRDLLVEGEEVADLYNFVDLVLPPNVVSETKNA